MSASCIERPSHASLRIGHTAGLGQLRSLGRIFRAFPARQVTTSFQTRLLSNLAVWLSA